jgi:hypothetical protein
VITVKTNKQKTNWIIDFVLFAGFLVAFMLDFTGIAVHQWLGVAVGLLAGYHLLAHWDWVESVTFRFLNRLTMRVRLYYVVDAGVLIGLFVIATTGLLLSTWLDLPLAHYTMWRDIHVAASIGTLLLIVLKIGMHWRWVIATTYRHIFPAPANPSQLPRSGSAAVSVDRRQFLKMMGIVGAAAVIPMSRALDNFQDAGESESGDDSLIPDSAAEDLPVANTSQSLGPTTFPSSTPTAQPTATNTAQPTATKTCVIRCNRGCSYPGHCRRYTDTNGNNRCDLGECMS